MLTEIILPERIETLGKWESWLKVKPGYAQFCCHRKSSACNKENIAYFGLPTSGFGNSNNERRTEAENLPRKLTVLKSLSASSF